MLSVCSIFRDEAPYLKEWIEFHLMMGAERFTLYDNRSQDGWREVLKPYGDVVEVVDWPYPPPCVLEFLKHYLAGHHEGWTAFIDPDEFLYAPEHVTLAEFLEALPEEWGALAANWLCFGSSGLERHDARPMIERFVFRHHDDFWMNHHVKSVVRMDRKINPTSDNHWFEVEGGTFDERGRKVASCFTREVSHERVRVNHYTTKSRQEYMLRAARGRVDKMPEKSEGHFDSLQSFAVEDRKIQKYLPELKSRLEKKAAA